MLTLEPVPEICPDSKYFCFWCFFCSSTCTNQVFQITGLVYAFNSSSELIINSFTATTSLNDCPSTHLIHRKPAAFCSLPDTPLPLHLPWIYWLHCLHLILLEPTPFLQLPHGHFPRFSVGSNLALHFINFVLPKFTLSPSPPYSLSISESSRAAPPSVLSN